MLLAPVKYGTPMSSDEYSSGVKSVPDVNEIIFLTKVFAHPEGKFS